MITLEYGDLFESDTEARVIPVNEMGVMGAGLAREFVRRYQPSCLLYSRLAQCRNVITGRVLVLPAQIPLTLNEPHPWLIFLPTKQHWKEPSQIGWIDSGLQDLKRVILQLAIKSIAIPALGCGLGGLSWDVVSQTIDLRLGDLLDVDVRVFPPR